MDGGRNKSLLGIKVDICDKVSQFVMNKMFVFILTLFFLFDVHL